MTTLKFNNALTRFMAQFLVWVTLLAAGTAHAATPSEAFQRAEYLGKIIEKILVSDLYEGKLPADPAFSQSRPRHVLRLATHVYENIQILRELNNLSHGPVIRTKAREVKPDDVIAVLNIAIKSILELTEIYQVDIDFKEPAIIPNKKPGDVLARLRAIDISLVKLGSPETVSNDVFRVSLGIKEEIALLAKRRNIHVTSKPVLVEKATLRDALDEAAALINDLDILSKADARYSLPNGVTAPPMPQKGQAVVSSDVLLATQFALADVYSLNVSHGLEEDLVVPPPQAGHSAADVKNILAETRAYLLALTETK